MIAATLLLVALSQATPDVDVVRNVEFARQGEKPLLMDIYRAKSTVSRRPAVVFFGGGMWDKGGKDRPPQAVIDLAKNGFVSISASYRPTSEAKFPAQIHDVKAAIRWLRVHASEYGIEPDRIGVWGIAGGGHLAALAGTSGGMDALEGLPAGARAASSAVQAVVSVSAPTDLVRLVDLRTERKAARLKVTDAYRSGPQPEERLLGGTVIQKADLARQANPATFASADDPPFLLIHGEDDTLVFADQSVLLHEALRKAGVKSELRLLPRTGHGLPKEQAIWLIEFFQRTLVGAEADR
jgi:acetyl esterase/lipase